MITAESIFSKRTDSKTTVWLNFSSFSYFGPMFIAYLNYFCNITFFGSDGAGRTGAYIAIDYLTQQLQEEAKVDVVKLILRMRESRKDMVQNVVRLNHNI